ncbi:MAG: hypothetical protein ACXWCN_09080 [Caldimonas sp.]
MSAKPPTRLVPRATPADDRGAGPAKAEHGSLRWVRNVLGRSLRLEQRRAPQGASTEPRRGAAAESAPSLLMQQRAGVGARLLVHDPATQTVRNLFVVHDTLRNGGWAGVENLPPKIVGRALTEAEILESDEPSSVLATIIASLREIKLAADAHAAEEAQRREWETLRVPEVSETNYDEYELMERSWVGTVPNGLELPSR